MTVHIKVRIEDLMSECHALAERANDAGCFDRAEAWLEVETALDDARRALPDPNAPAVTRET